MQGKEGIDPIELAVNSYESSHVLPDIQHFMCNAGMNKIVLSVLDHLNSHVHRNKSCGWWTTFQQLVTGELSSSTAEVQILLLLSLCSFK